MITLTHTPTTHDSHNYTIVGDNLPELIPYCVDRIRQHSKRYYEYELITDLSRKGESLIDRHAGMGTSYNIKLTGRPTLDQITQLRFKHLSNAELIAQANRAADFCWDDEGHELDRRKRESNGQFDYEMRANRLVIIKNANL